MNSNDSSPEFPPLPPSPGSDSYNYSTPVADQELLNALGQQIDNLTLNDPAPAPTPAPSEQNFLLGVQNFLSRTLSGQSFLSPLTIPTSSSASPVLLTPLTPRPTDTPPSPLTTMVLDTHIRLFDDYGKWSSLEEDFDNWFLTVTGTIEDPVMKPRLGGDRHVCNSLFRCIPESRRGEISSYFRERQRD